MSDNGWFRVGDWLVKPDLLCISRGSDVRKLEFKTMEILLCLVANKGDVVSKKKLHDEVWTGVYVTDNALTRGVSKLRKAFNDDPLQPAYIETISKSGYRLVAPVDKNIRAKGSMLVSGQNQQSNSKYWPWLLAGIVVITGLSLVSSLSRDDYSDFYNPVPVSTLLGPERALAISPDGEKISFSYTTPGTNNSDVYVKLLDDLSQTKFTRLESQQGYGIWSPDGSYMAYASAEDGTCGIYKEPSFGGEKVRIGSCFQAPEDFVWSPDGKTIAFTDVKSAGDSRKVYFLDISAQASSEVIPIEPGMSDRDPVFTPDGNYLVYRRTYSGQQRDIYKMHLTTKEITRLTFDHAQILGLDLFDNGEQVVFSSNRGGTWALWRISILGGSISRFHINDRVPTEPKFSPDGNRMVYKSLRDQTRIWAVENSDTGFQQPKQVASSTRAEIHPSLSHDQKKLVFISDRSGYFEIWTQNLEDNSLTKLTTLEGSFVNMPTWSHNDERVIFDARIDSDNAVYSLDIGTKMIKKLVDLEDDQVNGRMSIDGSSIFFASKHSGSWQIWKQSTTEKEEVLTPVTANGGYFLHEGPKDGLLYFTKVDTTGIWRINQQGEEELFIPNVINTDWGNWIPTEDGIIYIDRSFGLQVFQQPYDKSKQPKRLFSPAKRVQGASPSLFANSDGSKIFYVQIEQSEDEIMMVEFQ